MPTPLEPGTKAPAFTGKDQHGHTVSLKDLKGRRVILYFYPQDDTPACTAQACNLRDHHELLLRAGYTVIGVSPDGEPSHQAFMQKYSLPFPLLADPEHRIIQKYGVWGEKNLYGRKYMGLLRTTFVIDESGIIRKIFRKPRTKAHAEEILKAMGG
ncbi:MAG TPA: thioredoxin-dependent thiol peroxidase [Chitinophagaceae bacterium]|jgi:peroxiredoxin Q/BCP|nr:thioredoxin-dependent thiol peroxidase [Chitinophagaceae bacterium]